MSEKDLIPIDFITLIIQVLDGSISDAQFAELDQFIAEHPEAAQTYMECLASHVGLTDMGQMVPMPEDPTDDWELYSQDELLTLLQEKNLREETVEAPTSLHFSPNLPAEERRRQIELYAREQLESFLRQQHPDLPMTPLPRRSSLADTLGSLRQNLTQGLRASIKVAKAAAVILIVFSLLGLVGLIAYANRTVATVVETVDARWDRPLGLQARLRAQPIRLEEGYARIRLNQGAEVILQAPSAIELINGNRLSLDSGWITAQVPRQAQGFSVVTPISEVIDYGTEFGLLVGQDSASELHVFQGEVGLQTSTYRQASTQNLIAGQVATQNPRGRIEQAQIQQRTRLFMRQLPANTSLGMPGKRLNLADLVGGGNGLGTGLMGQGLNPGSGDITGTPLVLNAVSQGFQPVDELMFVDGVFIPDAGQGPIVTTSTGLTLDQGPDSLGLCRASITCGGITPRSTFNLKTMTLDDNTEPNTPTIAMTANAGITFDLRQLRSAMSGVSIQRFQCQTGLPTQRASEDLQIWVLVDGEARFAEHFSSEGQRQQQIDIDITPNDQFLTFMVTAPAENDALPLALFVNPMLELD